VAAAVEWVDELGHGLWSRVFGGGARVVVGGDDAGRWSGKVERPRRRRGGGGGGGSGSERLRQELRGGRLWYQMLRSERVGCRRCAQHGENGGAASEERAREEE
jgi:hypothetical protein